MQVTFNISDDVAELLEARGVQIPTYVEKMLTKEAHAPSASPTRDVVSAAVDRILERRKGIRLDGLKIRDLIEEGRRY